MKKVLVFVIIVAIAAGGLFVFTRNQDDNSGDDAGKKSGNSSASDKSSDADGSGNPNDSAATKAFKKSKSVTTSNSLWFIANKQRPLQPASYAPNDLVTPNVTLRLKQGSEEMQLRKEAATALEQMFADAKKYNVNLMLSSAYRSYDFQKNLYNYYVDKQGQAEADTQSARPGYSEHQTGLAADVGPAEGNCVVEQCFADTPGGMWVAEHAYKHGFVIRYPKDKQSITGYIYEPWHLRYVGKELATKLHDSGNPTLEEYFGLGKAPDYK